MTLELSREQQDISVTPAYNSETLTDAATEYSWTIPEKVKKLVFHIRTLDEDLKYSFTSGGPYIVLPAGAVRIIDHVLLESKTLYLQCDDAVGKVVDIEYWI